jgi:Flp pilus assembly protein TadG
MPRCQWTMPKTRAPLARARAALSGEEGAISVFSISFTVALLLLGGLALDSGRAYFMSNRLAGSADAAALAAAQELPETATATQVAYEYIEKNLDPAVFGPASSYANIEFGVWDPETKTLDTNAEIPRTIRVTLSRNKLGGNEIKPLLLGLGGFAGWDLREAAMATQDSSSQYSCQYNGLTVGMLLDYLFVFTSGYKEAKWEKENYGFVGDIALDGIQADEEAKIKGSMPFEGTLYTNDTNAGEWDEILDLKGNKQTASLVTEEVDRIDALEVDMFNAIKSIHELDPTPGWEDVKGEDLPDMSPISFQNGTNELIVIDVTDKLKIEGDRRDLRRCRRPDRHALGREARRDRDEGQGRVQGWRRHPAQGRVDAGTLHPPGHRDQGQGQGRRPADDPGRRRV